MSMKKYNQTITTIHVPHYIVSFSFNSPFSHKWKSICTYTSVCVELKTESSYSEWADDEFDAIASFAKLTYSYHHRLYHHQCRILFYGFYHSRISTYLYFDNVHIVHMYVRRAYTYFYLLQFYVLDRQIVYKKYRLKTRYFTFSSPHFQLNFKRGFSLRH